MENFDNNKISHKSLIICLNNFKFKHSTTEDSDDTLFVARTVIINKLVNLLECTETKRGCYLLAGYRGVGKTSIINRAIKKYKNKIKKSFFKKLFHMLYFRDLSATMEININLGESQRLTAQDIFYSITNILHSKLSERITFGHKLLANFFLLGLMISSLLLVLITIQHIELDSLKIVYSLSYLDFKTPTTFYFNVIASLNFLVFLVFYSYGKYYHSRIFHALEELATRIKFETTDEKNFGIKQQGFNFGVSRKMKSLPLEAREVEFKLIEILKHFQSKNMFIKANIVFVFDEIDKLTENYVYSNNNDESIHITNDSFSNRKMERIDDLLATIKYFITTANARFFFIAGRETLDRYYSERGSANSLYESLFDQVIEIPSLLTDDLPRNTMQQSNGTPISKLIEEYVCRRIGATNIQTKQTETNKPYSTLNEYYIALNERIKSDKLTIKDTELAHHRARLAILTLRNFVNFLTFHSWGNPKRLASIFESFVRHDEISLNSKHFVVNKSIFINSESSQSKTKHYLYFSFNSQRSLTLTSSIFALFQHELSREISQIGDKITVSALSSLQFILKLHEYGFTRESLHRMSEAINIHRSPELNNLVDDLLSHVFKPYIRRVRNGTYRYRFNSGFEQELRYIINTSDLESASYNFSLDAMHRVKQYFEIDLKKATESNLTTVAVKSHITLGDMNAIEQSYNAAATHYASAINLLNAQIGDYNYKKINQCFDIETVMLYVEAMIKSGDLEEHRQNYNKAAALYSQVNKLVCCILSDKNIKDNVLSLEYGDSKWDIFKHAYWASQFLSLKRSPTSSLFKSNTVIERLTKIFSDTKEPRFYFRRANLYFFNGLPKLNEAINDYITTIEYSEKFSIPGFEFLSNERRDYLIASSYIGIAETVLIRKAVLLVQPNNLKENLAKIIESQEIISKEDYYKIDSLMSNKIKKIKNKPDEIVFILLLKAAQLFKKNGLYINAVVTYLKIIAYWFRILDFYNEDTKTAITQATLINIFDMIDHATVKTIECIEQARELESSQFIKTLVIRDYKTEDFPINLDLQQKNNLLPQLLELIHPYINKGQKKYPIDEDAFWQHSIWAQKLVSFLYWGELIREKLLPTSKVREFITEDFVPSKIPALSIRASILMRWVYARKIYKKKFYQALYKKSRLTKEGQDFLCRTKTCNFHCCPLWSDAYQISRNLYFTLLDIRLISRKNLDLIFPTISHAYHMQWMLLRDIIEAIVIKLEEDNHYLGQPIQSSRDITIFVQNIFQTIDSEIGGIDTIAPSHFDFEYISIKLKTNLQESMNIIDQTSRVRTSILQQKYFAHDDHSDPEFRLDWTLSNIFCPAAELILQNVNQLYDSLKGRINKLINDEKIKTEV